MRAGRLLRRLVTRLVVAVALAGLVAALLAVSNGPERPSSAPVASAGCDVVRGSLLVDGTARSYRMCLPDARQRPAPLVVALHGLGGSGRQMLLETGLGQATHRAGVALLVPDSTAGAWNDGRLGVDGPRDEQFVLTLVQSLVAGGLVDPRRVTLAGFSNGADLALVLASRHPDSFAAVVGVSAHLLARAGAARPTKPIPTYLVYGTADAVQPLAGRAERGRLRPALLSASETSAAFVRVGMAGPCRSVASRRDGVRIVHEHCAGTSRGAPVDVATLTGVGHVWPRAGVNASALVAQVAARHSR